MINLSLDKIFRGIVFSAFAIALFSVGNIANAGHEHEAQNGKSADAKKTRLVFPIMNVDRGKTLFVAKGCVACHAVNGVGGHDAQPMDDHTNLGLLSPFDFVAKMWNHAPGMLAAQEEAFGEQITFTGEQIADIIAFIHDDDAQHSFLESDLTPEAKKMMHHEHGGKKAPEAHAKDIGHSHAPGTAPHKD
jgi:cytochrome c